MSWFLRLLGSAGKVVQVKTLINTISRHRHSDYNQLVTESIGFLNIVHTVNLIRFQYSVPLLNVRWSGLVSPVHSSSNLAPSTVCFACSCMLQLDLQITLLKDSLHGPAMSASAHLEGLSTSVHTSLNLQTFSFGRSLKNQDP